MGMFVQMELLLPLECVSYYISIGTVDVVLLLQSYSLQYALFLQLVGMPTNHYRTV